MSKTEYSERLAVLPSSEALWADAERLARELSLPLLAIGTDPRKLTGEQAVLCLSPAGLVLQRGGRRAPGPVTVDFGAAGMRHRRRGGQNELLGRAAGVGKKPALSVIDATAGLGRDAFVLADLGCEVLLCERDPVIHSMLAAGLAAAAGGDSWLAGVAGRMRLAPGDARDCRQAADVILLDPMFPQRDKSAAVKKEMALFQFLLGEGDEDEDTGSLLAWALDTARARVVVKRPPRAPTLPGPAPSHAVAGKAVRFDVYVLAALN